MRDPEREDLVEKGDIWDWIPTLLAFLVIYAVLLIFYKPNLLFSLTTTAGGDTGAHHYPAQYLIQELLPHFRLTGWAPGWYAGMPMLTFYFPFPFLLIAILNWFLPYQLAFKLVTVLGVFALPATAYAMGRLLAGPPAVPDHGRGLRAGLPPHGELLHLRRQHPQHPGRRVRLHAELRPGVPVPGHHVSGHGEAALQHALRAQLPHPDGAGALAHRAPPSCWCVISPGLLLVNPRWRSLGYLAAVAAVGLLPHAPSGRCPSPPTWSGPRTWPGTSWARSGPPARGAAARWPSWRSSAWPTPCAQAREQAAAAGLDHASSPLVLFWVLPDGRLWNARILPFFYFSLHLWAAYGATWLVRPFTVMMRDLFRLRGHHRPARLRARWWPSSSARWSSPPARTAAGWIKWNYSGYEGKAKWPQYKQINNFIDTLAARPGDGGARPEDRRVRHAPRLRDHPLLDRAADHGGHPHGGLLHGSLPLHQPGGAVEAGQQRHHRGRTTPRLDVPNGHHPPAADEHPLLPHLSPRR